jgi:acetoin utilization deacetylase AcuC-like enzyme
VVRRFSNSLQRIAAFRAEALIISLGVDTVAQDTVGDFHLTFDGFERLGRALRELAVPVLFVQEGGYSLTRIGQAVAAVLNGFAAG